MKTLSPFRLRAGDVIRLDGKPPALGFTPAQARARGQDLMDSNSARAGLDAPRPFRRAERISVLTRKFAGL